MKKVILFLLFAIASQAYGEAPKSGKFTYAADLLVWKMREGGTDNWAQLLSASGTQQPNKLIDVPFHSTPGYRLSLGYQPPGKIWTSSVTYTSFQTIGTNQADGRVFSSFLANFYVGNINGATFEPYYDHGDIRWTFAYKTLDLNVSRSYNFDNVVSMQPTIGLKTAQINQNMFTNWDGPHTSGTTPVVYNFTHATEDLKNNYFGIGPSLGVNSTWPLYTKNNNTFNLAANIQGALMWGYWRFKDVYQNNAPSRIADNINNLNSASTMAAGLLGLEWQHNASAANLTLRLSYEAQVWFSQMQFYSLNMGKLNNLMSLQGATLSFNVEV